MVIELEGCMGGDSTSAMGSAVVEGGWRRAMMSKRMLY